MIASAIGSRVDLVEQRISATEANTGEQAIQIEESNVAAKAALKNARAAKAEPPRRGGDAGQSQSRFIRSR